MTPEAVADPREYEPGVHSITKKTDYWFERELYEIEQTARAEALEWARKGLPRHDVARVEPFEPEQVLLARCAQLFRDWQRRVRTRMQDAIEAGSQAAGRQVAVLRNAITRLEAVGSERGELQSKIIRLRREAESEAEKPVRYERYINGWVFGLGAFFLGAVEFFANFPVFRLMLPMSRALAAAAMVATDAIDPSKWYAGPIAIGREMLMHFEATVVAFVAVIALVLLGKTLGGAIRPLLAFRAADHPLAASTIRSHQRQKGMLTAMSLLGICFVLWFLYSSRGSIAELAAKRVQAEEVHIGQLKTERAGLADFQAVSDQDKRIEAAEDNKRQLEDDAAYAQTVQANNKAILALNLALVLTAIVLGYSYKSEDLTDKRGEHPEIVASRQRLGELDREMFDALGEGRRAESQAHSEIAGVHHLLRASPLREWRSKLERLDGVVPLFRGVNARERGLDPANIRAFDAAATMEMPPVADDETFLEPTEFSRLKTEFAMLSTQFARLAPRMTPAFGQPAIS